MDMNKKITLRQFIDRIDDEVEPAMQVMLEKFKPRYILCYQNVELGSRDCGHRVFFPACGDGTTITSEEQVTDRCPFLIHNHWAYYLEAWVDVSELTGKVGV